MSLIQDIQKNLLKNKDSGRIDSSCVSINDGNKDVRIACDIVEHIFRYIDICLTEDKSKKKLSLFSKSFIKGILTENVKNGINDFVRNMNDKEVSSMLDDIQIEINKRDKINDSLER